MATRTLQHVIPSMPTSDGAGVKLRRSIGVRQSIRVDPFLMLDEFGTDNPDDYIAGFPPHPHRGFETVTYMLDGRMRHEDHLGNVGELSPGSVQWMTAGSGIIHSEMPMQSQGRMRGFQLWLNLPAGEKMKPPRYQDIPASQIPVATIDGGNLKVIAGRAAVKGEIIEGPIQGLTTDPYFLDIHLGANAVFEQALPEAHNAFLYAYEGSVDVGEEGATQQLKGQAAGVLSSGSRVRIRARHADTRIILLAGKPIGEPIVQHGPFVMNTREEIEQAIDDYRHNRLAQVAERVE